MGETGLRSRKYIRTVCVIVACIMCFAGSFALLAGKPIITPSFAEKITVAETGMLDYSDGSHYIGDVRDGEIRNGTGSFSWNTGERYEGTWVDDVPSGSGKMVWPGLGIYEGEFQNGKRQGHGVFTWTYEGDPADGKPLYFDGEWVDDHIGTSGILAFANLGVYEGDFAKNLRSGIGKFTWENGDQYYGNWVKDQINGEGILTLADGTLYEGVFSNNILNKGTATYSVDGGMVVRDVQYGKIQPTVAVSYKDGTIVTGKLNEKGEFTGNVNIAYSSGDSYVGTMKNGKKSGKGTYTWTNGAHYNGEWADDKMSGSGKYYFGADEKTQYLSGKFNNGKPEGTLVYVSEKRLQYNTVWKDGQCTSITYKK